MPESLAILEIYEQIGIKELWLTPHVMEDIPNSTDVLRKLFRELDEAYMGTVKLRLASENMLDNLFAERLENNDVLPIGNEGNTLLIETSYFNPPIKFHHTIDTIRSKGYHPLLAHPERYNYIDSISDYRKLKDHGVKFQLNLMSLCGHYGSVVRDKAKRLLEDGMYDRVGSDLHGKEQLEIIRSMRLSRRITDRITGLFGQR